jgi:hypothetical protein
MLNVSPPAVSLSILGCIVYVLAMSALGRRLAACREECSVPYVEAGSPDPI